SKDAAGRTGYLLKNDGRRTSRAGKINPEAKGEAKAAASFAFAFGIAISSFLLSCSASIEAYPEILELGVLLLAALLAVGHGRSRGKEKGWGLVVREDASFMFSASNFGGVGVFFAARRSLTVSVVDPRLDLDLTCPRTNSSLPRLVESVGRRSGNGSRLKSIPSEDGVEQSRPDPTVNISDHGIVSQRAFAGGC
ncbi:hypothetical protein B296_00022118, partial [Ensete ventricosum]